VQSARRVFYRLWWPVRFGIAALLVVATASLVAVSLPATAQEPSAVAELKDEGGKVVGRATLTQDLPGSGVWILVEAGGLAPGTHGIHIHAVGTCTAPGFTTAGGHFNPEGRKHGFFSPEGAHGGDLPNMVVPASGLVKFETANYRITLTPGANSLFDADGSSLVIHAAADDYSTDPAGNSGARVVCGVITRR
jgi:Cu-Zn family superoxide dismutase